jgi:hypothetical protein
MLSGVSKYSMHGDRKVDLPKSNRHAPYSLGLEAVATGYTSPVRQARVRSVEVLDRRGDEGVGILRIDLCGRLADDVAVEEGHGLSERDCANDKGDEEERVDTGHD